MWKQHFREFKTIISTINMSALSGFTLSFASMCFLCSKKLTIPFHLKLTLRITSHYQSGHKMETEFHNMLQTFLLDMFLPPSPSSSPSLKPIMQICFLSWRVLENFRLHFLHSKLPGETSDSSVPSSVPGRVSSLGTGLFSATSSSTQNFLVEPFGLPLFLFATRSSRKRDLKRNYN